MVQGTNFPPVLQQHGVKKMCPFRNKLIVSRLVKLEECRVSSAIKPEIYRKTYFSLSLPSFHRAGMKPGYTIVLSFLFRIGAYGSPPPLSIPDNQ
jgi:hypothetical protein